MIFEDNEKLRGSLAQLIDGSPQFQVVGAFPDCSKAVQQVEKLRPEVILMDIDMPRVNGIKGVQKIKETHTDVKILMHTVFDDSEKLFACLKVGADGYLLKKTHPVQLLNALEDIYTGGAPMSPGIARRLVMTFREIPNKKGGDYKLTKREKQVLQLLTEGFTYKEISSACNISMDTVATHLRNVYQKLHVNCGTAAVAKAIREKLI